MVCEVAKGDCDAIRLRKAPERAEDSLELLARENRFVGAGWRRVVLLRRAQTQSLVPPLGAEHVVCLVDDDPKEPRPEGSARLEAVE